MPINHPWPRNGPRNMAQKLDDLPKKGSKYWTDVDAEVKLHHLTERPCKHRFDYIEANTVQCINCKIGFFLLEETLKEGHIYKNDKLVI